MMSKENRGFDSRILNLLQGTAVFLLVFGVIGAIFVWSGIVDPKPIGELQVKISPVAKLLVDENRQIVWQDVSLPVDGFSVRETAVFQSGNADSFYGIAIGNVQNYLVVGVSPLGYAMIEQSTINSQQSTTNNAQISKSQPHLPFQTWPHVRTGSTANEIWVDVVGDRVTVRLNRELLWIGDVDGLDGRVGIWGESFGETAVIDFQQLQLFWEVNHE